MPPNGILKTPPVLIPLNTERNLKSIITKPHDNYMIYRFNNKSETFVHIYDYLIPIRITLRHQSL